MIEKLNDGMATDLGMRNVPLSSSAMKTFFQMYGALINEETIENIINRWINLTPQTAVRVRTTLTQARGSGLTTYITIGKAMKKYPDFNWGTVSEMYPEDWNNFTNATQVIGDNAWYGFSKNLGQVAATKYRILGYIAKELFVKVGGDQPLSRYQGWTNSIPHRAAIDRMIAAYEELIAARDLAPRVNNAADNAAIEELVGNIALFN